MITVLIAVVLGLALTTARLAALLHREKCRRVLLEKEYRSFQEEAFVLVSERDRFERVLNRFFLDSTR